MNGKNLIRITLREFKLTVYNLFCGIFGVFLMIIGLMTIEKCGKRSSKLIRLILIQILVSKSMDSHQENLKNSMFQLSIYLIYKLDCYIAVQ